MEVTKQIGNQSGYDFYLKQDNKTLKIVFGGNLDLYWNLILSNEKGKYDEIEETFVITKENYYLYSLFEKLINDIKEANIFEPKYPENEDDRFGITTEEECKLWNTRLKNRYFYDELYNSLDDTITWRSDDEQYDYADRVKLSKIDDNIVLEFTRPKINQNTYGFRMSESISIRFRTSGSRYDEFYVPFMRMFNKLQDYDPNNHQIHIEELNYNKKLTLHR